LFAAGLGALISTYGVPAVVTRFDLPTKIATGVLIYVVFRSRGELNRLSAAALIAAYVAYLLLRPTWFPTD
jgi:hypothetical protein